MHIGTLWGMKALALSLAELRRKLHHHRMFPRRPGVVLPTWKWWEIRKHIRADWRRYQKSRAALKKRRHYKWVSKPLRQGGSQWIRKS